MSGRTSEDWTGKYGEVGSEKAPGPLANENAFGDRTGKASADRWSENLVRRRLISRKGAYEWKANPHFL
jgi:hypothetical protein